MSNYRNFSTLQSMIVNLQFATKIIAILTLITPTIVLSQGKYEAKYEGVGRTATANELAAWDIDVRPDFKGLPKGMGSVAQGEKIWGAQCASCHGEFGESNSVFAPLAGSTTKKDSETGRVAALHSDANTPSRTTMMKVAHLSTLWDYINRAMPWTAPKSLKPNEVYALTAYMLNLANVVPENFTLSDKNILETQKKMPNRNGMTTSHAMWPGSEFGGTTKPDAQGSTCTSNCATDAKVASFLPEYARNAHGNLAEQTRSFGPSIGANTTKPSSNTGEKTEKTVDIKKAAAPPVAAVKPVEKVGATGAASATLKSTDVMATLNKYACSACHGIDNKIVGPGFKEIAQKQSKQTDAVAYLMGKIKGGSTGVYGSIPMPPQNMEEVELKKVSQWIASGAAK